MNFFSGRSDVRSSQQCKYKGLNECHQQFYAHHEHGKQGGPDGCSNTGSQLSLAEDEDQADKHHEDDVPCRDVGSKTQHQRKRLDEQPEELNRCKNNLHPCRHTGHPEDVLPVVLVAIQIDNKEGKQGQHACEGEVAGNV